MDYKQKVNKIFYELDEIVKLPFGEIPSDVKVNLFEALSKLATACNKWNEYDLGINSSNRNKENLDTIFNARQLKSSYQFIATFDGKYQPRVIDYVTDKGMPLWVDFNEETDNGQRFSDEELPKIAKQLEEYYANAGGGTSDIEIVKDNGDSVYLEEYLMEGSFDKAWQNAIAEEENWYKD